MAEKRMLTRKVTNNDNFTKLPAAAQALYLHLTLSADDDGFCDQVSTAMFRAHAKQKDLDALVNARYILRFENDVIVIKHWRMANAGRADRYTPTVYQEEYARLTIKPNKSYTLADNWQPDGNQPEPEAQPAGNHSHPQKRIEENRREENTRDTCVTRVRAREEEADDAFEAFWNAYPRKIGGSIQQAYMEYVHVTDDLGVAPSVLIDAAREQGKDLTPETARYFPGAEKWLRNRGWEQKKPKAKESETNNIFMEIYQEEHSG